MRTVTFAQAQAHYDNMMPEDYGDGDEYQTEFDSAFVVGAGQLVMTPDGTGILTGDHEGETTKEWDDGYYLETTLTAVEVAVPGVGTDFYSVRDIEVRTKDGRWVSA